MLRPALCAVVLGVIAVPLSSRVDCGIAYVSFLERPSHSRDAMSGDQLATLHRSALRIFRCVRHRAYR